MKWLKKYDEIVEYLRKTIGQDNLTKFNGVIVKPERVSYGEFVPNDIEGEKFEGQRKKIKETYDGAVKLIQTTPDIIFSASRTEKLSN